MNCIIIEDELPAQRILHNYISKVPDLNIVGSFQSALEANAYLQHESVAIIFLDINLPDISGIQYVRTLVNPPQIIITTAYHEHAVESFELDAICDYLVKPFSFERFLKAINKTKNADHNFQIKEVADSSVDALFVNIDKTLHKVYLADIVFIESNRNYISITTTKGKWTYIESLKNWMEKLSEENFIQVHKSFIVNHKRIDRVSGNLLYLADKKVPIGRLYKSELLKKLNLP